PGAEKCNRTGDVLGRDESTHWVRGSDAQHLLSVRKVLERSRLDDTGRDGVDPDRRCELDCEVADERLERRLRGSDQGVVVEHAGGAEGGDGDDRGPGWHAWCGVS